MVLFVEVQNVSHFDDFFLLKFLYFNFIVSMWYTILPHYHSVGVVKGNIWLTIYYLLRHILT